MFGVDWSNSQTLWLNLTNLALGIVTILALAVVVGSAARELLERRRLKASEFKNLDAELKALVNEGLPHVLPVPGLGLTMADGGEPLPSPGKQKRK